LVYEPQGSFHSAALIPDSFGCVATPSTRAASEDKITPPETFFGFQLGADREIARWDKIAQYFSLLEKESPRIKVINMGPTTMGHPFLLVIISSPDNLASLETLKEINNKITDPRQVPPEQLPQLISQGRAIICQSMSLHADEIGGTQMAPELAYDLLTRDDAETRRILENVVFLLIPCFNPDGQIMVTDWYNKTLGTEYEAPVCPIFITFTPGMIITGTAISSTSRNLFTPPVSSTGNGSRRLMSTITTWEATAPGFMFHPTATQFVPTPTRSCGASCPGLAVTSPTDWKKPGNRNHQ